MWVYQICLAEAYFDHTVRIAWTRQRRQCSIMSGIGKKSPEGKLSDEPFHCSILDLVGLPLSLPSRLQRNKSYDQEDPEEIVKREKQVPSIVSTNNERNTVVHSPSKIKYM